MKWLLTATLTLFVSAGCMASGTKASDVFSIQKDADGFVHVMEAGNPVFRYVTREILKEGVPEDRRRSTYIHPLYGLDGSVLTDDFPEDHFHHRGVSWMWMTVTFDGVTKDLWTLKGLRQRYISHTSATRPDRAVLQFENEWIEDSTGRKILDETVHITTHKATEAGRAIDFRIRLAAVDTPVTIATSATGYSGFGVRMAPREDAVITSSNGHIPADQSNVRHTWADFSARFQGKQQAEGVTIFQHRANPYYPDGWTLRYYGYLSPNFTNQAEGYTIAPGKPLTLRFRLWVHKGPADPDTFETMLTNYHKGL